MDSLLPGAPDRLNLANWLAVAGEGARVSRMTVVFPYHPTDDGFFPLSTTSLPNPTAAAGSLFLRPAAEQDYLQRRFPGPKAFVANSLAYRSLAEGFTHAVLSSAMTDEQVVEEGLRFLREQPEASFLRLILQQAIAALQRAGFERSARWPGGAHAEGSPHPEAVRRADALLGRFTAGLRGMGRWDDTLLVPMPDGASRAGWHGPQDEAGWRTIPLAIRGPGVARGRVTGCAEHVDDAAHAVAALAGVAGPARDGASGRVIAEVTAASGGRDLGVPERLLRFNQQLNASTSGSRSIRGCKAGCSPTPPASRPSTSPGWRRTMPTSCRRSSGAWATSTSGRARGA